ncbi:hypothetical protein BE20_58290 [Sorangium cellulosum]|nr:hypothetical protein BE20_58290 [Sorangium cellulosum]
MLDDGHGRATERHVLAEARGIEDLRALREHLRIQEGGPSFHCMCLGDLTVELLAHDQPLASISFHHARSLRKPDWSSDAMLVDGPALVRWLAARGAPGPLREYEEERERARTAQEARRLWLAAAPPCFAPDLPRFEDDANGLPLGPMSPEVAEAERRLRASYATPELACAALLAWLGTGAGPWSGYPAYEMLPENLLLGFGLPTAIAAASAPGTSEAALRGAARLFASWEVVSSKKSQLGDIPEALWERLRTIVRAMGNADNLSRFERAEAIAAEVRRLRAQPAPFAAGAGLAVAGVSSSGRLSGLVTDGDALYSGDGNDIVMFQPGRVSPVVLLAGTDPFFELAPPVSQMLFVAHANVGTISKVLTEGSPLIVMARNQARPMSLVHARGFMAWVNQAMVPDPERGAPFVVQRSTIMEFEHPTPRCLHEPAGSAFSLACDEEHLYWCELSAGRLELWRHPHHRPGAPSRFASLGEHPIGATWYPKLTLNATHVLWADPDRRAILGVDKRTGVEPVVLAETRHPPAHVVAEDRDIFALTGQPDSRAWHVEHIRSGASTVVADYQRQLWDRPDMVLNRRGLFFTTNDRILTLARS